MHCEACEAIHYTELMNQLHRHLQFVPPQVFVHTGRMTRLHCLLSRARSASDFDSLAVLLSRSESLERELREMIWNLFCAQKRVAKKDRAGLSDVYAASLKAIPCPFRHDTHNATLLCTDSEHDWIGEYEETMQLLERSIPSVCAQLVMQFLL